MLLQFSVTNHRSIKETAIISMKAAAEGHPGSDPMDICALEMW